MMQERISPRSSPKAFELLLLTAAIAFIHAVVRYVQTEYLVVFNNTPLFSVFYLPAAVRVFSAMLFGYRAALGIALGLLIEITFLHPVDLTGLEIIVRISQTGLGVCISLMLWTLLSKKVTGLANPRVNFAEIDAFDVLLMCLLQAVANSTTAHLFYVWSPSINHHFDFYYYVVMLVGDLTGSFFFFIIANIAFSMLKRSHTVSQKHYDDTMHSQFAHHRI